MKTQLFLLCFLRNTITILLIWLASQINKDVILKTFPWLFLLFLRKSHFFGENYWTEYTLWGYVFLLFHSIVICVSYYAIPPMPYAKQNVFTLNRKNNIDFFSIQPIPPLDLFTQRYFPPIISPSSSLWSSILYSPWFLLVQDQNRKLQIRFLQRQRTSLQTQTYFHE